MPSDVRSDVALLEVGQQHIYFICALKFPPPFFYRRRKMKIIAKGNQLLLVRVQDQIKTSV
jgi:hypothetical protein